MVIYRPQHKEGIEKTFSCCATAIKQQTAATIASLSMKAYMMNMRKIDLLIQSIRGAYKAKQSIKV